MMYIYFDENNYVYGYGSEQEEGSVEVDSLPREVDEYLGCYKYVDGKFVADEDRKNWLIQRRSYEDEALALKTYLDQYRIDLPRYQSELLLSTLLGLEPENDLDSIMAEAEEKQNRLDELVVLLNAPYTGGQNEL